MCARGCDAGEHDHPEPAAIALARVQDRNQSVYFGELTTAFIVPTPRTLSVNSTDVHLTQNVYQHVYDDAKREAAGKIEALLTAASAPETPVATKPVPSALN
jgi:hypothetical protein